ncbi:MAG: hypothetical protein SGI73_08020 [Chloroflexota bacterium]|nr:hypothetical protein [Chloroflexota bacterium]
MAKCTVCERDQDVTKCANPRCRNWICKRHALRFEVADVDGLALESFCSRACYMQVQRRALPNAEAFLMALIIVLVAFGLVWITAVRFL